LSTASPACNRLRHYGRVPPNLVVPEFEVFVGKVAISPYKTPGTAEFAQTVLPFVKQHNTVLLANHGIVCWADTVTHAGVVRRST